MSRPDQTEIRALRREQADRDRPETPEQAAPVEAAPVEAAPQAIRSLAEAARSVALGAHVSTTSDGDAVLVVSKPVLKQRIGDFAWTVWACAADERVLVETRSLLAGGLCGRVVCDPDEADEAMAESEHLAGLSR